jgi:GT2 family glycosyltransferase
LRCAAQGINGRYVPEARAIHLGSAALGRWHPETVRRMARNQVLLAARHYGARHLWPVLIAQLLWGAVALRHGRGLAWARGKVQGLRLFSAARKERQRALPDGRGSDLSRSYQSRDRQGALDQVLHSNEQFIRTVNRDTYWKLYFLLTGGAK